jgi:hypothetical protein
MELYEAAGVKTSMKNLCFVMPIIIFRYDITSNDYRIGQLQHDQSISTISMPLVEECKFGRQFFHVVKDQVHVYINYKKVSQTPIDMLYDHATRLAENEAYLKDINIGKEKLRPSIEPLLENTQFIDAYTKFEPTKVQSLLLRFDNTDIYGYRTKRRIISSFEDLIAYSNQARFDDGLLHSKTRGFMSSTSGGDLSGLGDQIINIGETILRGVNTVVGTGVNTVEKVGSVLDNVADFFTGGFLKVIIIVAAIACCGLVVYMMVKHRLLSEDEDDHRPNYASFPALPPSYYPTYPQRLEEQQVKLRNNAFNNVEF